MADIFIMKLGEIQPSQLYISAEKLSSVLEEFDPSRIETLRPMPIKELGDDIIFTDGHTRAFAAYTSGLSRVRVFCDEDELDREAYQTCVDRCKEEGIYSIADLKDRVVNEEDYELLWRRWCDIMHRELDASRSKAEEKNGAV